MDSPIGDWIESRTLGDVTEICVMAPIRLGRVPGERRTFEERIRFKIKSLMTRATEGKPNILNRIITIHFARMFVIRPDQYLLYSGQPGFPKKSDPPSDRPTPRLDPYDNEEQKIGEFRSWLFTQVIFDGDIKVYFRDIAELIAGEFDEVFENCEEFPGTGDFEKFWTWIRKYQIWNDLFLSAYPNLSVARIKHLEDFKRRFDLFVARVRSPNGEHIGSMDELFDDFLRESQQYASGFPAPGGVYQPKPFKTEV